MMLTIIDLLLNCLRVSDAKLCFNCYLVYTLENGSWALYIRSISNPPKHLQIKHKFFPLMNLYLLDQSFLL